MIDDLFAFMRYEHDCWRLQIYHAASPIAFISHERKQVVIQLLNVRKLVAYTVISKLQRQTPFIKI